MKRILSIGRIGGQRMDEALIHRLARQCLSPLDLLGRGMNIDQYHEVLDNIKDAIRGAYNRGRIEVTYASHHAETQGGV